MSKAQELQKMIRLYKEKTGETEIDMTAVAKFAVGMGWPLPKPTDPIERLAQQITNAARQEIRRDKETNRPYRANHAVPTYDSSGQQVFFWIDIDDPKTTQASFRKSAVMRREQMVSDGLQLSFDIDHWNGARPDGDKIDLPWDLTMDIEIRRAVYDDENGDDQEKAA